MTDALRKKLATRAKNWNTKMRTPSEIRSERLRKNLARGLPVVLTRQLDCRDCTRYPCGVTLEVCGEETRVDRCRQCGVKVLYRYVETDLDYKCPVCKVKR